MSNDVIAIPLEEYKELLIIKGRYEELKEKQSKNKYENLPQIPYMNKILECGGK